LAELFLINTKAHILTQSEDYQTAFVRITELIDYIMQDKAIVYGYFDKKELAGFIWVFPYEYRKEERYLLNAITVLPEYRKKHIASRLFESVENEIYGKKTALFTFVDVVNEKGRHFYQRHGMEEEAYQLVKNIHC
jgi:ribosomal protein S18 acetylase RimI-like enzyme